MLQNYRVRLFDEVDRAMASDDQMEEPGDRVRCGSSPRRSRPGTGTRRWWWTPRPASAIAVPRPLYHQRLEFGIARRAGRTRAPWGPHRQHPARKRPPPTWR
jgi:hypothetical protein